MAQSPGHHTIDRLEERGIERESTLWYSVNGRERAIAFQTYNRTVWKARNLSETVKRKWAFSSTYMPSWTKWTELYWTLTELYHRGITKFNPIPVPQKASNATFPQWVSHYLCDIHVVTGARFLSLPHYTYNVWTSDYLGLWNILLNTIQGSTWVGILDCNAVSTYKKYNMVYGIVLNLRKTTTTTKRTKTNNQKQNIHVLMTVLSRLRY